MTAPTRPDNLLEISQDTLILLPDGATGGAVTLTYSGTTAGAVIGGGDSQGRAVITEGRQAKLTALDGQSPIQVVGREAGGRLPARITIRIYPEYQAGVTGSVAPITLTGLPVGAPDVPGVWDLSNIDDASGGLDVVTPAERQSIALLREQTAAAAGRVEGAVDQAGDALAQAQALTAGTQLPATDLIVEGVTDAVGRVATGVTPHGSQLVGWADTMDAELTHSAFVDGVADGSGQVATGVDTNGNPHQGHSYTMPAPGGYSGGTADQHGYVLDARDALGRPILHPGPTVWLSGDQVYSLVDGVQYQVTHGSGNSAPVLDPGGRTVTYTSTRSGTARPMRGDVRGLAEVTLGDWGDSSKINHLQVTGQSLSLGVLSTPPLSVVQAFGHLKFSDGTRSHGGNAVTLVPLVEDQVQDGFFDSSQIGETALSAVANGVSRELERRGLPVVKHRLLGSVSGRGGTAISGINKGTPIYTNTLAQWDAGIRLAGAAWRLSALVMVHGENDDSGNNTNYAADLWQLLSDYQADLQQRVPGHGPVPMLVWQIGSWGKYSSRATPVTPPQVLQASEDHPDQIVLVGPNYWIPPGEWADDRIHLRARGSFHAWEKFAQAYRQIMLDGHPWLPLKPISTRLTGRVITVKYHVPAPPLVLDTINVSNPGDYGIEVEGPDGAPLALARVEVAGADTVRITLAADPPAGALYVRHAWTATPGQGAGPDIGPRCCLRDSDPLVSALDGKRLYNWAVVSRRPVPYGGN